MQAVLTIAGSDSSGGAGIQADLKTIAAHRLFGESVITALTAQNTLGVTGVLNIDPAFVGQQIDAVFEDIRPAATKIGMVSTPEIVRAIGDGLRRHLAVHVVVDPVMVATSGSALMVNEAVQALIDELFPLAEIVTPNLAEAEVLASMSISTAEEVEQAAELIADRCVAAAVASPRMSDEPHVPAILIKGGHLLPASHASEKKLAESGEGEAFAENVVASDLSTPDSASATANDYLRLSRNEGIWLKGARVETSNTHGTGCSLSSAIACNLAQGYSVDVAVRNAKAYVTGALASGLDLGKGSGPLNHMWQYGPVPC